jgi:D-sedoheptulose 7-phosphate isomerase
MIKQERIAKALREQQAAMKETFAEQAPQLAALAEKIAAVFHQGGRLYLCGSGAQALIADHTALLFLHRLALDRPALPAHALGGDARLAAAVVRDGQGKELLGRELRALAQEGDLLIAFAELQSDAVVEEALRAAHDLGCGTAVIVPTRSRLELFSPDFTIRLETESAGRITELTLFCGHLLCELVENELFGV